MSLSDLLNRDKIIASLRSALSPAVLGMLPTEILVDIREVLNTGIGSIEQIIARRRAKFDQATQEKR